MNNKSYYSYSGLDPAGPFYYTTPDVQKLSIGDASFVQVIHTCVEILGYNGELGNADYWPNDGSCLQPGCGVSYNGEVFIVILI